MSDIEKLIEVTQTLCCTLEHMSENERRFGYEIAGVLEHLSYDAYKMSEDLKAIKSFVRGVEC